MKKYIAIICTLLFTVLVVNAQSYKIIVNNANSVTSLSKQDVSNYLLKKRDKWSNNLEVIPIDLVSKSPVRESFSKEILNKSIAQVRAYWQQSVFSGKDTPPREMESDSQVVEFVKSNPGAIGYVSAGTSTQGVKVVSVN